MFPIDQKHTVHTYTNCTDWYIVVGTILFATTPFTFSIQKVVKRKQICWSFRNASEALEKVDVGGASAKARASVYER